MQHTPRLCIDGRAASDFASRGMMAQEVIDQLVSAQGEPNLENEWVDRQRTVLLSHPGQIFSGQLKRFETRRKIGRSPLYWLWEKNFVKSSNISVLHRFVPADRIGRLHQCPTITTVLPAETNGLVRFPAPRKEGQAFVVPSEGDKKTLEKKYRIVEEQMFVVRPSVRRYVHFTQIPQATSEGLVLLLVGDRFEKTQLKKLERIVSTRYPALTRKKISLKNTEEFAPTRWVKTLQETKLCFYLTDASFDWPTLALESIYWGIPTIFMDGHAALSELLPQSGLSLSRYLIEHLDFSGLALELTKAQDALAQQGRFEPLALAKNLREVYSLFN